MVVVFKFSYISFDIIRRRKEKEGACGVWVFLNSNRC